MKIQKINSIEFLNKLDRNFLQPALRVLNVNKTLKTYNAMRNFYYILFFLLTQCTNPHPLANQEWNKCVVSSINLENKQMWVMFHPRNSPEVVIGYDFFILFKPSKIKNLQVGDVLDKKLGSEKLKVFRNGKLIYSVNFLNKKK